MEFELAVSWTLCLFIGYLSRLYKSMSFDIATLIAICYFSSLMYSVFLNSMSGQAIDAQTYESAIFISIIAVGFPNRSDSSIPYPRLRPL